MTTCTEVRRRRNRSGFTLTEIAVSSALSSVLVLAILMSYSMTTRGFTAAGNYSDLERDARVTLDNLSRDARIATGLVSYAASDISLAVPTNFSTSGAITGSKTVRYYRGSGANTNRLYRLDVGKTNVIADNVTSVNFIAYDRNLSTNGISASDCKLLQVDITLRKYTLENPNTEQILSARIVLRNKLLP